MLADRMHQSNIGLQEPHTFNLNPEPRPLEESVEDLLVRGGVLPTTLGVAPEAANEIGIFGELSGEGFTAALIPTLNTFLGKRADGRFVCRFRSILACFILTKNRN